MGVEAGHRICCSVKTFFWTNFLWGFFSLALLVTSIAGLLLKEGVFVIIPEPAYYGLICLSGFGFLVSSMGMFGQALFFVYALLYANDVATITKLDTAAGDLQKASEDFLISFSQESPADWKKTQDQFGCCGVDFEAGLQPTIDLVKLESGDRCAEINVTNLAIMRGIADGTSGFDPETEEFELAAASPLFGDGTGYFCKEVLADFLVDNTIYIGIVLGVILLSQLSSIVSASRMYWVTVEDGGWYYELEGAQTAADYGGGIQGNIRAAANRVSTRFNHATTPNPEAPTNAGMFGRLSMRRTPGGNQLGGQVAGFGGPGGPPPPMGGGQGPSFLKRLSNRMNIPPLGGMFGFPPRGPPGPPPPMGGMGGPPMGGPPMGGPPMGGMGGPPMGGPPMGGMGGPPMGGPPMGGMGGPPMGGPPMGAPTPPAFGAPRGAPPLGGSMGGPPMGLGGAPRPPPRGFGGGMKRLSARLTQGLNNVAKKAAPSRFGGGLPAPNTNLPGPNTNVGAAASPMGLPTPNSGLGGAPPPRPSFGGGSTGPPRGAAPKFGAPPKRAANNKAGGGGFFGGGKRATKASKKAAPAGGAAVKPAKGDQPPPANPLMAQIQGGMRLKKAQTHDRSAPKV